jgi:ssDNA-binding Zn-finger/Zn-ribbon topoisomerase 1
MPKHDNAMAFSKTCKRCGGCSELALTLSHERYDVYQCPDCKFVDWIARETREPKASFERSPRTDSIEDEG